jgi:6-phospho-3-hexuloisomerase
MAAQATGGTSPWHVVRNEVCAVLSTVVDDQMIAAAALFGDRTRRWFCSGQGRSGLVARMAAMRLMHVGFDAHAVGEATAPSVAKGDGLVMILTMTADDPRAYAFMRARHTNMQ